MFKRIFALVFAGVAWLSFSPLAVGHPHEWIDIRVRLLFNSDGHLEAMEQAWLFDPFFSAYVIEELNQNRPNKKVALQEAEALGPEMVENLSKHDFLNQWFFNDEPLTGVTGSFTKARILRKQAELNFRLEFAEPLDPKTGDFTYRVFDPTYYIEILHAEGHRPKLHKAPRGCKVTIETPQPSDDILDYAASLDLDEQSEDGLGINFAETARLTCRR